MFEFQSKMIMTSRPSNQVYQIKSPVQNGEKLYLDKKTSDAFFTFESADTEKSAVAGDTARIAAHRILLANKSVVFKEMFYGDDGSIDSNSEIPMTDVSQAAVKEFLQFFYLNEVELHAKNIAGVMHLGQKYKVMQCIELCVQFLKDTATANNILITLDLAVQYNRADLLKFCEQFIAVNTDEVLESGGFLECEKQMLAYTIIASLFACSEVKLFESCMEWVKAQSKQDVLTKEIVDEYLGDLFYEIRFGSMTIQELCNLTMNYDAVLSDDFKTIAKMIVLPNFQPDKFNTRPRPATKYIDIKNEQDNDFEDAGNDDAVGKNNSKRGNAAIVLTNKRVRLISSSYNNIDDQDSFSNDEEMEYAAHAVNGILRRIGSRSTEL